MSDYRYWNYSDLSRLERRSTFLTVLLICTIISSGGQVDVQVIQQSTDLVASELRRAQSGLLT